MMNSFCAGHVNDFGHLGLDLGGLKEEYDLGFKLEEKEPDEFSVNPNTGVKAFAEPFLVLYISVRDRESPKSTTVRLSLLGLMITSFLSKT